MKRIDEAAILRHIAENGGRIGPAVRLPDEQPGMRELVDGIEQQVESLIRRPEVYLPLPPSANHIWRAIIVNGTSRLIKSKPYRDWLKVAVPLAKALGKYPSPVGVSLLVCGCNVRSDIDNFCKPVLDALRFARVIQNDSVKHVRQIGIGYQPEVMNGYPGILVKVWSM